jgi:predicted DsbA family dithiol-disulfide isomerase
VISAAPGTLLIYADIACPWATLAVARLWEARTRLGLDESVRFDFRAFPLELFNSRPTPHRTLDAEIPVAAQLARDFGWHVWQGRPDEYPVTTLLALEAVQAAKEQGLVASEEIDLALRRAFFVHSRCISLRSEVLAAAESCDGADAGKIAAALDDGRARSIVTEQWQMAQTDEVRGSPHVFAPDGTNANNPGVTMHWHGDPRPGFPVIDRDDPSVIDDLLMRAAG